jgi:hypothetical protein
MVSGKPLLWVRQWHVNREYTSRKAYTSSLNFGSSLQNWNCYWFCALALLEASNILGHRLILQKSQVMAQFVLLKIIQKLSVDSIRALKDIASYIISTPFREDRFR